VQLPIAEAEMADKKFSNVNGSPKEGIEKKSTTKSPLYSIPIIEYNGKAKKQLFQLLQCSEFLSILVLCGYVELQV